MKTRHWRGRRCFVPPRFADYISTSDSAGEPFGRGAAGSLSLKLLGGVVLVLTCEMLVCSVTAFTSWGINHSTKPSATPGASHNIRSQLPFYLPRPSRPRSFQALPSSLPPATSQEAAGPLLAGPCPGFLQTPVREGLPKVHRHTTVLEVSRSRHPGLAELLCNTRLLYYLLLWPCKCLCRYRDLMLLPIVSNPSGLRRAPVSYSSCPVL